MSTCDNCPGEEAEHRYCDRCIEEWRAEEDKRAGEFAALRARVEGLKKALRKVERVAKKADAEMWKESRDDYAAGIQRAEQGFAEVRALCKAAVKP